MDSDTLTIIPKIAESQSANSMQMPLPHGMELGGGNTPIILHPNRITSEGFQVSDSGGGVHKPNDSFDNVQRCSTRGIDTFFDWHDQDIRFRKISDGKCKNLQALNNGRTLLIVRKSHTE